MSSNYMSENMLQQINSAMYSCNLCGRHCHVNRLEGQVGYCGMTNELYAARAALHFYEEPCISGTNGSGAVFFSGCSIRCVFCQNHDIALGKAGLKLDTEKLSEVFLMLQNEKKAHNINLVTGTHYIPQIAAALKLAKKNGLTIPIVYNTGSYETVEALHMLDGLIDIYLPDLKYYGSVLSAKYSHCEDYFITAQKAIKEMYRQVGTPHFQPSSDVSADLADLSEQALMTKGIIVRHLLLPGCIDDSKKILEYLYKTYQDSIFISIMNQYTPMTHLSLFPELTRKVSSKEYDSLLDYAISLGIENAFIQGEDTADESFIPVFNGEGLLGGFSSPCDCL